MYRNNEFVLKCTFVSLSNTSNFKNLNSQKSDRRKNSRQLLHQQLLEKIYKQVQKYNFIGRNAAEENIIPKLTMTCIYTTRYGSLRAYGSAVTLGVVNHKQVFQKLGKPGKNFIFLGCLKFWQNYKEDLYVLGRTFGASCMGRYRIT